MSEHRLSQLMDTIGYRFKNEGLLLSALTHRSLKGNHNERLEFLGDSLVNCIIAETLYHQFPHLNEGELSRIRARLVKEPTLATLAREFSLSAYLRLGAGEIKTGGAKRDSILADALEALIAAIYLDSNFIVAKNCIIQWFNPILAEVNPSEPLKDPKTRLQEFLQRHKKPLPCYNIIEISGKSHAQTFTIHCCVEGLHSHGEGKGHTRRNAEQEAALQLLNFLESNQENLLP